MNKHLTVAFLLIGYLAPNVFCPLNAAPVASKADLSSVDSDLKETSLGDLTADSLRISTGADIAFVPASALRQVQMPEAGLTSDEIAGVLEATTAPANAYVEERIKGRQILSALEHSLSRLPQAYDGFLQVSGIRVTYDSTRLFGDRIVSVQLLDGTPIVPDSQYIVAMTHSLGLGGMGYFQAWDNSDVSKTYDGSFSSALSAYVLAHQPFSGLTDGRLKQL
jgi:5'-nucleotidase/UDP-sugar diphosphatase